MSTTSGRQAEAAAAKYLSRHKHKILEQNWRTRWCEIDLITQRKNTVYFVEVKYRATDLQGGGLDYITPRKLQQMHFAAEFWLSTQARTNFDYRLAALEISGPKFTVANWLDDI